MELRQMQYLIAIYEHGGLSAAAEKLFLTPQALSKSIRKLEEELDAPLFYREKNSLILTPFGKKVLPEVQRLVADYEDMMRRLEQISAQERGRVRLAFSHGVPNALSLDSLRSFEEAHPEAVVDMVSCLICWPRTRCAGRRRTSGSPSACPSLPSSLSMYACGTTSCAPWSTRTTPWRGGRVSASGTWRASPW